MREILEKLIRRGGEKDTVDPVIEVVPNKIFTKVVGKREDLVPEVFVDTDYVGFGLDHISEYTMDDGQTGYVGVYVPTTDCRGRYCRLDEATATVTFPPKGIFITDEPEEVPASEVAEGFLDHLRNTNRTV